jgi:hypothetical protein
MDTTTVQLTKQDLVYFALIGAGGGLLLGLIPLILAIRKGKIKVGLLAVVCSTIAGAFSLIISLVVIALFIWLILKKSPIVPPESSADTSDSTPEQN